MRRVELTVQAEGHEPGLGKQTAGIMICKSRRHNTVEQSYFEGNNVLYLCASVYRYWCAHHTSLKH